LPCIPSPLPAMSPAPGLPGGCCLLSGRGFFLVSCTIQLCRSTSLGVTRERLRAALFSLCFYPHRSSCFPHVSKKPAGRDLERRVTFLPFFFPIRKFLPTVVALSPPVLAPAVTVAFSFRESIFPRAFILTAGSSPDFITVFRKLICPSVLLAPPQGSIPS